MHVLVVEDDLDTRDLLQHALKKEGHEVLQASGVSEALRLSCMHPDIDVVVMDMHLCSRQMIEEATREIRQRLHNGHYVLASGDWDTLEPHCREQQDTTVLRKPYGKEELLRAIGRCVARLSLGAGITHDPE
jgi:CheY-like chemotaxis protein